MDNFGKFRVLPDTRCHGNTGLPKESKITFSDAT